MPKPNEDSTSKVSNINNVLLHVFQLRRFCLVGTYAIPKQTICVFKRHIACNQGLVIIYVTHLFHVGWDDSICGLRHRKCH